MVVRGGMAKWKEDIKLHICQSGPFLCRWQEEEKLGKYPRLSVQISSHLMLHARFSLPGLGLGQDCADQKWILMDG